LPNDENPWKIDIWNDMFKKLENYQKAPKNQKIIKMAHKKQVLRDAAHRHAALTNSIDC